MKRNGLVWRLGKGLMLAPLFLWSGGRATESAPLPEGPARLVHDFFQGEYEGDRPVEQLMQLGSSMFFVADDLESGQSVWRTDGTPAGTGRVSIPGYPEGAGSAAILGTLGSRAIWWATAEGTPGVLVAAAESGDAAVLHTNPPGSSSTVSRIVGQRLFFQDCVDASGCRFWSTDGTAAGTQPVSALARFDGIDQEIVTAFADRWLVFRSRESLLAYDLPRDEVLLLLPAGAHRIEAYPVGETLYLVTRHDRARLWSSRLNAPRAVQLFADRDIGIAGWRDGRLYFASWSERLWSTEGLRENTRRYAGFGAEPYSVMADRLGSIGTTTFLPMPGYYWGALLGIDETKREVRELLPVCSGKYPCLGSWMSAVTMVGDQAFEVIDGQLWRSDGTPEGTTPHETLEWADADTFRALDGRLILSAISVQGERQLWETDGTAGGTRALTDGTPDRPFLVKSAPVPFDGALFVAASRKPVGQQLWRVEAGRAEAITGLRHLPAGFHPYSAVRLGNRIVASGITGWVGIGRGARPKIFLWPMRNVSTRARARSKTSCWEIVFSSCPTAWKGCGPRTGPPWAPAPSRTAFRGLSRWDAGVTRFWFSASTAVSGKPTGRQKEPGSSHRFRRISTTPMSTRRSGRFSRSATWHFCSAALRPKIRKPC
jgi:hypothetical protein